MSVRELTSFLEPLLLGFRGIRSISYSFPVNQLLASFPIGNITRSKDEGIKLGIWEKQEIFLAELRNYEKFFE
jgi:hypothetical protein